MNCINCGTQLVDGNNTCPSCGALNMAFGQVTPINTGEESAVSFNTATIPVQNVVDNQSVSAPVSAPVIKDDAVIDSTVAPTSINVQTENKIIDPVEEAQSIVQEMGTSVAPLQVEAPSNPVPSVEVSNPQTVLASTPSNDSVAQPSIYDNLETVVQEVKKEKNIFDTDDDVEDLEPVEQVDANIAPPSLEVNNENLTEGVSDITAAGASASTYESEPVETPVSEEVIAEKKEDQVDISIPQVQVPVDNSSVPVDGSAPEMNAQATVGSETKAEDLEENIEIAHKSKWFKIPMAGKNSLPIPFAIVGMILFLLMGLGLGSVLFSKNYCSVATKKTEVAKQTVADGKNNITKSGSYTYTIPNNYNYDRYLTGLFIYDEKDSYRMYIKDYDSLYEDLANSKSSIKSSLEEQSITVNSIKEMKVNGKNYLLIEANNKMYNSLIGFTDAGDDNVFYFEIIDNNNNYNYDVLDIIDDIVSNAVYGEELSSMEKISLTNIADITILTAQKYKSEYSN